MQVIGHFNGSTRILQAVFYLCVKFWYHVYFHINYHTKIYNLFLLAPGSPTLEMDITDLTLWIYDGFVY